MFDSITRLGQPVVDKLTELFINHKAISIYYTAIARWVFVALALFILSKAIVSLLSAKSPSEIWAYLKMPDGKVMPLTHWENVIGRAGSSDIVINIMTVSRNHGTLIRDQFGDWYYNDLGSKSGSMINGNSVYKSTPVEMGDTITIGGADCILIPPSFREKRENLEARITKTKRFLPWSSMFAITVFQILTCIQLIATKGKDLHFTVLLSFLLLTTLMWGVSIFIRIMRRTSFEMESIAFFLCTLSLAVVSTSAPGSAIKQLFAIVIGVALYLFLSFYLRNLYHVLKVRRVLMIISAALLLVNFVFGSALNGATIWVKIGGYSLQPSELVKIAFIFIGAARLDELYEKRNLTVFMIFSMFCLATLALMNDFGTALIFFVTYLVISFLRSGEFTKLILILGVCLTGGLLAIRFVSHIAHRFATWRHVWDMMDGAGWQQTRAMSAGASGGLLGVGAGNGWLKGIFASNTDMVFCYIQEEWGLIIAILAVVSIITLGIFAVKSITSGRSTFYTIAACAATSLLIFQTSLNVLGTVDILPFTGVTLPFISNGGTSMISSWGLLAFLKAADTRQGASLAVQNEDEDDIEYLEDYLKEAGVHTQDAYENIDNIKRPNRNSWDKDITDFSQL